MDPPRISTTSPSPGAPSSSSTNEHGSHESGPSSTLVDTAAAVPRIVRRPTPGIIAVPQPARAIGSAYSRYPQTGSTPLTSPVYASSSPGTLSPATGPSRQGTGDDADTTTAQPAINLGGANVIIARPPPAVSADRPVSFDSAIRPSITDYAGIGAVGSAVRMQHERSMSAGREILRREMSTGSRDILRDLSAGRSDFQRQLSTGRSELERQMCASTREVERQLSTSRNELERQISAGRSEVTAGAESVRRELSVGRDEVAREISGGRAEVRHEALNARDDIRREVVGGRDEVRREYVNDRDELRRDYVDGRDEIRREYTSGREELQRHINQGQNELRRELAGGQDEITRQLNTGRDALAAEVNLGQAALRTSEIALEHRVNEARDAIRHSEDALRDGRPMAGASLNALGRSISAQAGHLGHNIKEMAGSVGKNLATNAADAFVSRMSGLDHVVPVIRTDDMDIVSSAAHAEQTVGRRLEPTLIHARLELAKSSARAKWTGHALNAAIAAQVVFGALTTGISAATTGRKAAIGTSVLGGMSTLAASYLARARGSGEPELSIARCKDIENFIRDCEAFCLDHGHLLTDQFDVLIDKYRRRFEEIIGNGSNGVGDPKREKTSLPV